MLICNSCWIFLQELVFWALFCLFWFYLVLLCIGVLISLCTCIYCLLWGLKSFLGDISLVFLLNLLDQLDIRLLFLFFFFFCLLLSLNMFCSGKICCILRIWSKCLVRWLCVFFLCSFRCSVCFLVCCSWFRFPIFDCKFHKYRLLSWYFLVN